MSNAVQTSDIATIGSLLEKTKTLMTINAWIRDFPELMYVGLYLPNMFADGGKLKNAQLSYAEQKQLNFKMLGSLEASLTVNANEVVWYEAGVYAEETLVTTANTTANVVVEVNANTIKHFKAKDVVLLQPAVGSSTTEVQVKIVSVDLVNNELTLDTAVECEVGDRILFLYNSITYGTEITRGVAEGDAVPVRSYFQTYGDSVEFNSNELNQTRLLVEAKEYVKSKFAVAINSTNNKFAKAFWMGRNVSGTESETQGLNAVVNEIEARDGTGSAIVDFTGITEPVDKIKKLVEVINRACTAPVYNGGEVPTAYCNLKAITSLTEIKIGLANFFTLDEKTIEFGLQSYSSPYFRNIQFIVSQTLNKLEPNRSVIQFFPKHLVTFKTPQFQSVNEMGALIMNKVGGYQVLKMPQTSVDITKYTAQMRVANIFAGQSFPNTYIKVINI